MKTSNYAIDDVLRYADQAVQDEQSTRAVATLMATLNGEQFAHVAATLMATLYTHPMPAETRRAIVEAAEIAVVEVFGLGQDVGWDLAVRWAGVEHTHKATSVRVQGRLPAIEARREKIRAFCQNKKRKWPYDMPELAGRLAVELGDLDGKKRTRATLRKLYARDLTKLARDTTT